LGKRHGYHLVVADKECQANHVATYLIIVSHIDWTEGSRANSREQRSLKEALEETHDDQSCQSHGLSNDCSHHSLEEEHTLLSLCYGSR
jgi:hypothetical protein